MTGTEPFVFTWGDVRGLRSWAKAIGSGATIVLDAGNDDRWLRLDAPDAFANWVGIVADLAPDCRSWVSVQGLNAWPVARYVRATRLATGHLLRALDHQLSGYLAAVDLLDRVASGSVVEPGIVADLRAYELSTLLTDVLAAPGLGVTRRSIGNHLRGCRRAFELAHPSSTPRQRVIRRLVASAIPLEQALPRAIDAVYTSVAP